MPAGYHLAVVQAVRGGVTRIASTSAMPGEAPAAAPNPTPTPTRHERGGSKLVLLLRFSTKARRAIGRALRHHHLKASVAVTMRDLAGRTARAAIAIRLKR